MASLLVACEGESRSAGLRAQPETPCVVEVADACAGEHCAVEHDFVLRCPGEASVDDLQLALDHDRVRGAFRIQGRRRHAFQIDDDQLELIDRNRDHSGDLEHLGGGPPSATLRQGGDRLALLTATGDDWVEVEIAGTEGHEGVCPTSYTSTDPSCPPCMSATSGVEDGAHQLARTTDGELWGAWLVTDAIVEVRYMAMPLGSRWRCTGTASSTAAGILHLVELDVDGSWLRSREFVLDDVGFHPSGDRELAIAASGDRVALLLPSQHHGADEDRVALRVLVVDTSKL